jgi:predicted transcriptional regulator
MKITQAGLLSLSNDNEMPQRDNYDIVKDILEKVYDTEPLYRNQMNQTRIGYDANLTHPQTVKYLRKLVELGLLFLTDFKPYSYYEITKKGRRCLQLFGELENDLRAVTFA